MPVHPIITKIIWITYPKTYIPAAAAEETVAHSREKERYNSNPRGQMVIVPNKVDDMALLRAIFTLEKKAAQFLQFRVPAALSDTCERSLINIYAGGTVNDFCFKWRAAHGISHARCWVVSRRVPAVDCMFICGAWGAANQICIFVSFGIVIVIEG